MTPLRALLLDFDGTLVDSLPALRGVYDDFLAARGRRGSDAEFAALNGPALPELVARLRDTHGLTEPLDALRAEYAGRVEVAYREATPARAGAAELLIAARRLGLRTAIVTGCPQALCEAALERLGLLRLVFDVVDCASVSHSKPAGDVYRRALSVCEVDASEAWAVEDSPAGLAAARAAGVRVLDAALGLSAIAARLTEACAGRRVTLFPGPLPRVRRGGPLVLPPALEALCAERFAAAQAARGAALFDGPVDFLDTLRPGFLGVRTGAYRHFLASRTEPRVRDALPGPPVAVGGLVLRGEGPSCQVLLGQRGPGVTQYPLHWESVPAGGLGGTPEDAAGDVDWPAALRAELLEECGVHGAVSGPVALLFDAVDPIAQLCAALTLAPEDRTQTTAEYPNLMWAPLCAPPSPCVPATARLLALVEASIGVAPAGAPAASKRTRTSGDASGTESA